MNCTYCGTRNPDDEHRCRRCGRRLHLPAAHPAPRSYPVVKASVAPDLFARPAIPAEAHPPAVAKTPTRVPRQATLFSTQVLQFEDYLPPRTRPPNPPRPPSKRRKPPAKTAATRKRERLETAGQQVFDLQPVGSPKAPETASGVEPVRYCQHPVAHPVHRLIAATLDFSMIAAGVGLFLAVCQSLEGTAVLNSVSTVVFAATAAGILGFYRLLWWLAGGDSPGMTWAKLRLLNFDGRPPTRSQRAQRFLGTCLSLAAGGLGLFWALGDEEKLGWNDHISKTFPSPRPPQP